MSQPSLTLPPSPPLSGPLAEARADAAAGALFLARLSHEVRAPLSAAFDQAHLLRATALSPEQTAHLDALGRAGAVLLALLNDVHEYARLGLVDSDDHVDAALPGEPVDMVEGVEEALASIGEAAHARGLRLALVLAPALPERFVGDVAAVQACLGRALAYVAHVASGDVVVTVGGTWDDEGTSSSTARSGAGRTFGLRVDVRAEVAGIASGDGEALFVPFATRPGVAEEASELACASSADAVLSGLELPLARRIAAASGGTLTACYADGALTVTLCVPMRVGAPPVPPSTLLLAGRTAVVATPHAPTGAMLSRYLERVGVEARVVGGLADMEAGGALEAMDAALNGAHVALVDARAAHAAAWTERALQRGVQTIQVGGMFDGSPGVLALPALIRRAHFLDVLSVALRSPTPAPDGSGASPQAPHAVAPALRVLLAEDNLINQRVAQHLLARLGITPDLAANGREAVEQATATAYDLVLMDVMMPVMDGFEATQRIRGQGGAQPRIVAVTANAMPGDRERCIAAGMDDYLAKPIQLDGLARVLRASGSALVTTDAVRPADVLDLATLRDLRAMIGDDDDAFLGGLVADYAADATTLVADMVASLASGDLDTARRAAHTLKSSSGMIGARRLSERASAIEDHTGDGDLAAARSAAVGLADHLDAARRALATLRAAGFAGL